jgi:hypothetical protein
MRALMVSLGLALFSSAPAFAGTPFQDCQREATRLQAAALLTGNVELSKQAIDKQAECRALATEADSEAVQFQNDMNQLIRDSVRRGNFDPI